MYVLKSLYIYMRHLDYIQPSLFPSSSPHFPPSYLLPNFMSSFYNSYLSFIYLTAESSYCCPYVNMFGIIHWRMRGRPTSGHTHEKEVPMSQQPSCKKDQERCQERQKENMRCQMKEWWHHEVGWRLIWMG